MMWVGCRPRTSNWRNSWTAAEEKKSHPSLSTSIGTVVVVHLEESRFRRVLAYLSPCVVSNEKKEILLLQNRFVFVRCVDSFDFFSIFLQFSFNGLKCW